MGNNIAIVELSSSAIKILIGPKEKSINLNDFEIITKRVWTLNGINNDIMDTIFFGTKIIPEVKNCLEYISTKADKIICVATARARNIKNINEILGMLPIETKILKGEKECTMPFIGYFQTAKRDISKYNHIISIDMGSLTTEIFIHPENIKISLNIGLKKFEENGQSINKISWLKDEDNTEIICCNKFILNATGEIGIENQHDKNIDKNLIRGHKGLNSIMEIIGYNHELVANATGLNFGIYYSYLEGKF